MTARAEILDRIRSAIGSPRPEIIIPRAYRGPGGLGLPDAPTLFAERLHQYQALLRRCRPDEIAATIEAALAQRRASDMVVPPGFPDAWLPAGLHADPAPRSLAALDAADGVVTTCTVAVAATGTIVLDAGPGQGTRVDTLLPDYHLVVVRDDQVVAAVPDAISRLDPAKPLTWISGPSATSDIELDRVEGVHGPRTLEVVLVEGAVG